MNTNGEFLQEFMINNKLLASNTLFKHPFQTFFKIAEKQYLVMIVFENGRASPKLGNSVFGANMTTKLLAAVKL